MNSEAAASYLDGLNPAQRDAVCGGDAAADERDRPLLVIAGAGSGKTNTLAHRVAHLIAQGADPGRILLLTFRGAQPTKWCDGWSASSPGWHASTVISPAPPCPGPAPFMAWARDCCATTPPASGWTRDSRSTTAKTRPIS